ncbi:Hypothetical protein CAP_0022 [Chondromyces apiculatus DSM 436]|uniref:TonB-dependent receptor n=2 Tax=Chondromyces apiculatus TaxID=51 RepID=A0A017TI33_9BACT|nr:Hypothetical protein CAP_0022 [Chondromyces apiculatus DSM 436]
MTPRKTQRVRHGLLLVTIVAAVCSSSDAMAQERGKPRGVITLTEVTITGRIQKPIAAVDVSRIQPKLTLAELRQPFLDRIEQAIYREPF